MQHLAAQFSDRAMARIRQSRQGDGPASPRDIIGAIPAEGVPAGLDPDLEAISLMTMSAGLGTSVLGGHSSPGQAQAVIDYHLNRLFPPSRPAAITRT